MEKNQEKLPVSTSLEENIQQLKEILGIGKSFDVIQLDLNYADRDMAIFLLTDL